MFCRATPCIYAFLLCTLPAVWVLEFQNFNRELLKANNETASSVLSLACQGSSADAIAANISSSIALTQESVEAVVRIKGYKKYWRVKEWELISSTLFIWHLYLSLLTRLSV